LVLQQNRLLWYGHVLRKEDNDWVKKCMEMEQRMPDQQVDQRGLGERVLKDCQACKLNRQGAYNSGQEAQLLLGWPTILPHS